MEGVELMAWITPVTDRTSGACCTVTDMNRIAGNLDHIVTEATDHEIYSGTGITKTTYTKNDLVWLSDWEEILDVIEQLINGLVVTTDVTADSSTTYENFNNVEKLILAIYDKMQLLLQQTRLNKYSGEIYASDAGYYSGGIK